MLANKLICCLYFGAKVTLDNEVILLNLKYFFILTLFMIKIIDIKTIVISKRLLNIKQAKNQI